MIKNLLSKIKTSFKSYLVNHIGTNVVLSLIIVLILILDISKDSEYIVRMITALSMTAFFTLLAESSLKDKKRRFIVYVIGLIISSVLAWKLEEELIRYITGILLVLTSAIIYVMKDNSGQSASKYLRNVFANILKLEFFM